jgi:hypothetical protein
MVWRAHSDYAVCCSAEMGFYVAGRERVMSDPNNLDFDPPEPSERPVCASCGWTMWIAAIEPDEPGHDKHVFKCRRCDYEEIKIVKL